MNCWIEILTNNILLFRFKNFIVCGKICVELLNQAFNRKYSLIKAQNLIVCGKICVELLNKTISFDLRQVWPKPIRGLYVWSCVELLNCWIVELLNYWIVELLNWAFNRKYNLIIWSKKIHSVRVISRWIVESSF